jgi:MSHA biogenesis protein MshQ
LPNRTIFLLVLLACLAVLASSARAATYANVSTSFAWIDTTSHTKVGYNTVPYKLNDTGGCGTAPPVLDDTLSDNIPIGFTFAYGGTNFTQVRIMSNGRLQFNNNTTCGFGSPVTQLPYANAGLNYTMRIYGNDLDPTPQANAPYTTACKLTTTCYISYASIGTAPNRRFVVTWNNIPEWASGGSTSGNYNLQLILNEDGTFIYQYGVDVPGPQAPLGQVGWQVSTSDYDVPSVGLPANNSAILFYIPSPVAQYHFQQSTWTAPGQVLDTSASSPAYNGTALGAATPGVGYACNGAVIPANSSATVDGIDTNISVPSTLGGAGTIDFWYKANSAWVGGGNAQLLDASISNNQWFFATKLNNGDVRFVITDSTGTLRSVETTANNITAGTWVHIALTWNFNALAASNSDHLSIYINGTQKALSAFTSSGTISSQIGTLYLGDNRSSFTGSSGTTNSANGTLDEVNLYNVEGGSVLIQRDMSYSPSCGPDHYELTLPTSSITCLPATATITACADNSSPCANMFLGANGTTATLANSAGILGSSTVTFGATGIASTTLSYPAAANNTAISVTLASVQNAATNLNKCCPDGVSCTLGNSCSTTFNTAGFIFTGSANGTVTTIPTQVAGVSSASYFLRAVKTNTTTKACEAALQGTTAVNFAYECNDAATCYSANLMSINGGTATTIARNNNGNVSSYLPVNMSFDANGNAPFTFSYGDAGKVTLHSSKTVNAAALSGASNALVVKPYSFVLSNIKRSADNIANPAATSATGPIFIKAGDPFSATVTATTATGTVAPNYGQEATPENVKLNPTRATGLGLTNDGAISGTFGAFTNGVATGTAFSWSEVGIITLTPDVADGDYLGAGNVTGTATGNVGRFTPHHFSLSSGATIINRNDLSCSPASTFNYMDEPMATTFTLTAQNATNGTTQNYAGVFAKLDLANPTAFGFGAINSAATKTPLTPRLSLVSTSGSWTGGVAAGISGVLGVSSLNAPATPRTGGPDGPFDALDLGIAPTDTDGVQLPLSGALNLDVDNNGSMDHASLGRTAVRFGRLKLNNAFGSELLDLPIPAEAQYWNGTVFVTNTADNCTVISATNIAMGNYLSNLSACETAIAISGRLSAGKSNLKLVKPGAGNNGSVDLTVNLGTGASGQTCVAPLPATQQATVAANLSYLQGKWTGTSYNQNPRARATFGVYKNANEFIYMREMY